MIVAYAAALELLRHARPAAFLAGVLLTLLAQSALSAGVSNTVRPPVAPLEMPPVRAAVLRGATASHRAEDPEVAGSTPAVSAARTTATDETPASEAHHVPPSPRDDPALVVATIRAAALEFGVDPDRLVAIARCESHLDPLAIGAAGELGILQFKPATFRANGAVLGYRVDQVFDVRAQARTAAAKIAREGTWAWSCAR